MVKLTPQSCRAGRALLEWGIRDLGVKAGITHVTITLFENGRTQMRTSTQTKIITAFAKHGVTILNGNQPGARFTHPLPD